MTAASGRVAVAGLALFALIWAILSDPPRLQAHPAVALAAGAYVAAHGTRMARLVVLLGGTAVSVRSVAIAHAATAPIGLLPFKVGELARIGAIGHATGGLIDGVRAVWIERTFDAATIASVGLVAAGLFVGAREPLVPILAVAIGWIALTAIALFALPESLGMAKAWLIRRYSTWWSLRALRVLQRARDELRAGKRLVDGKIATLTLLTAAIWALEGLALSALVGPARATIATVVGGLLAMLSEVVVPGDVVATQLQAVLPVHRGVVIASVAALAGCALLVDRTRRLA